jgi:hypothetical protein
MVMGWNFFYMASQVKTSVLGFDTEKVTHRAIKRVLADLKADKFNSVEIGQVAADGFLGLRHVTVSAPRDIFRRAFPYSMTEGLQNGTEPDWLPSSSKLRPLERELSPDLAKNERN